MFKSNTNQMLTSMIHAIDLDIAGRLRSGNGASSDRATGETDFEW
jgi:hypothetical protein